MEQIKQAVERAKAGLTEERLHPMTPIQAPTAPPQPSTVLSQSPTPGSTSSQTESIPRFNEADLSSVQLEQHRIVAHNAADPRSRAFDMLRTQVLQAMDKKNWTFIAVTSPTVGCGKSVTAINLALSIARQPERSALLVDMDLQRPAVATYLGLKCQQGLRGVLEGRTPLTSAMILAHVKSCELLVLPGETSTVHSSELFGSRTMNTMLQDIRGAYKSRTVIFDMPPLLQGDEVLALLPKIDCVLLVTAAGISTQHQIIECNKHLQSTEIVRLVLNKTNEPTSAYYY
jgi:Mrp family chromosome partitioning ATPase